MKKAILFIILNYQLSIVNCQTNLIQNPSFEYFTDCPSSSNGAQINLAFPWFNPTSNNSPYYNACTSLSCCRVPDNYCGYKYARTGNAYSSITTMYMGFGWNGRAYIETPLTSPLLSGQRYWVEFYVSLGGEISGLATNNLGAYFSTDSLVDTTNSYYVIPNIIPQFEYSGIISDTANWVRVSGSFTAAGGERFMTLGNFRTDSLTDTLIINNPNGYAEYYIDDVSVYADTTLTIDNGQLTMGNKKVSIMPNPAQNYIIIRKENGCRGEIFILYDVTGRKVKEAKLQEAKTELNIEGLESGIYFWKVLNKNEIIETNKLIIIKN